MFSGIYWEKDHNFTKEDYFFIKYEPVSTIDPDGVHEIYKFEHKDLEKRGLISREPFKGWEVEDIIKLHRKLYNYKNIKIIPLAEV